jgi:hypothetical protein
MPRLSSGPLQSLLAVGMVVLASFVVLRNDHRPIGRPELARAAVGQDDGLRARAEAPHLIAPEGRSSGIPDGGASRESR